MKRPFEIIDHPADMGLRIYGKDLSALFRHAAEGFYDLGTDLQQIVRDKAVHAPEPRHVCLSAPATEDLLVLWLKELLYLFSSRSLVFFRFEFTKLTETSLDARLSGGAFNPARHESRLEVKAVTYHQLYVRRIPKPVPSWEAQVIFDT